MTARLTFCGGAGTVTGANFLLEDEQSRMLVDCGILQRERLCDPFNSGAFPYEPASIDALFVTHAHADHIGRIPKLVRDGFRGEIHSTGATKDLAALMFDDALEVMRASPEARQCGTLYEKDDIERALSLWHPHEYRASFAVRGISAQFLDAGHVLGSSMVRLTRSSRPIVFTGDLGNMPEPLLNDTESAAGASFMVMESVYGDRVHEGKEDRRAVLRAAIEEARAKSGVLLIPSFSIERTQVLLYELNAMVESGEMEPIPVFLDAPLAIAVTDVYRRYKHILDPEVQERFARGDDPFAFAGLSVTLQRAQSEAIHGTKGPKVIIAGSGMSHGGRIREHERQYLGDRHATILFVGYQTPGSLGRRIQDGEREVEIDGARIRVRARVATLSGYSGHMDRDGLISFVEDAVHGAAGSPLERVFVTMGEPKASLFLAQRLRDFLGVDAVVPDPGQSYEIAW